MRKTVLIMVWIILSNAVLLGQFLIEARVLERIRTMVQRDGRVTFSDLHNSPEFSPEEKALLGRLYEVFFQIPSFLRSEFKSTGRIPTRQEIAAGFGISRQSVELLLAVMRSDSRIPPLFERDPSSGEIQSLNLENLDRFMSSRGTEVKVTDWEGQLLPDFELAGFDGRKIRHSDLAEKNTLIYFWFTGCPPCVRIAPLLEDLHRKYSGANFQVMGFNADRLLGLSTTDEERKTYLREHNLRFANFHLDQETRRAFGNVQVFPTLFFVGTDRTIFRHMINFQEQETLEQVVRELSGSQ